MEQILVSAKGIQGELFLFPDRLRISRKGFGAFFTHGLVGEKDIFIKDISSIQYKAPGTFTNGYIKFAFIGGTEAKRGILEATQDENTVMFNSRQKQSFESFRDKLQSMLSQNKPSQNNDLENLEKLADLRNRGIISEDDFNQKKKQILGL